MKKDKAFEQEKKRALTPAEEKRLRRFETLCGEMEEKGYRKCDLTVGIVRANVLTIVMAVPICAVAVFLFRRLNPDSGYGLSGTQLILWLVGMLALTVVHEGIHGLTWSFFAPGGFKDIEFGFMKQYLTPYCTCGMPLKKRPYIAGALMPLVVLGIVPWIVSLLCGSTLLLYLSLVMILGAGGDMLIVFELLRHRSSAAEQLVCDHPTQAGCVLFER
jgi:hypothetical protein